MTTTTKQIEAVYGTEAANKIAASYNRPVTRPSLQNTIDTCEIMFWLAFSNIIGMVVATGIYNLLVNGRLF